MDELRAESGFLLSHYLQSRFASAFSRIVRYRALEIRGSSLIDTIELMMVILRVRSCIDLSLCRNCEWILAYTETRLV